MAMSERLVKLKKFGNRNILVLPKEIKPIAKTFTVFQGRDGMIVYIPQKPNPFKDLKFISSHKNLRQQEECGSTLFDTEIS